MKTAIRVGVLAIAALALSGCAATGQTVTGQTATQPSVSTLPGTSSPSPSATSGPTGSPEPVYTTKSAQRLLLTKGVKGFEIADDDPEAFSGHKWIRYISDSLTATSPKSCSAVVSGSALLTASEETSGEAAGSIISGPQINDSPNVEFAIYQTVRVFDTAQAAKEFITTQVASAASCKSPMIKADPKQQHGDKSSFASISGIGQYAWGLKPLGAERSRINSMARTGNVVLGVDAVSNDPNTAVPTPLLKQLWMNYPVPANVQ